jgi:hypothetical protein
VIRLPTTEGKRMKWKLKLILHKDIAAPQRKTMLLIRVEKVMNYYIWMVIRFILGAVGVVFMSKWKKMLLIKVEKVV